MKAIIGLSTLAVTMGLMTGCATQSEVNRLHQDLHSLEAKVTSLEDTANLALKEAKAAHEHAADAEALAKECKQICEGRMEKVFEKSMMK
ncbi:MAG TPA: hypothetical protein ENI90_05965 [Methylothermaceae bacterium]|nr:hypothetical protein [Methylothermaceae bacterium]